MARTNGAIASRAFFLTLFLTLHSFGWAGYAEAAAENAATTFLAGSALLGTCRCFWELCSLTRTANLALQTTPDEEDAIGWLTSFSVGVPIDIIMAFWGFYAWRDNQRDALIEPDNEFTRTNFYLQLWLRMGGVLLWYMGLIFVALATWARVQIAEDKAGNFERGPLTSRLLLVMGRIDKLTKRVDAVVKKNAALRGLVQTPSGNIHASAVGAVGSGAAYLPQYMINPAGLVPTGTGELTREAEAASLGLVPLTVGGTSGVLAPTSVASVVGGAGGAEAKKAV